MNTKICNKCGAEKTIESFHNDRKRKDGKYPNCRICHRAYARNRDKIPEIREKRLKYSRDRMKNPIHREKQNERGRKYYQSLEGRANTLWKNARKSPAGRTKNFTLTVEHILQQLMQGRCAVTKIKFEFDNLHQLFYGRKKNAFAPSIDRIDPRFGYTNQNTRIVIWWYNMAKAELSDREMIFLCGKVFLHEPK